MEVANLRSLAVDAKLLEPSRWELRLRWFPILGWAVACFLQDGRTLQINDEVGEQLTCRAIFPIDSWRATGLSPSKAEAMAKAIIWQLDWLPNHHFLPDDPLDLLLMDGDGMGRMVARYALERTADLTFDIRDLPRPAKFGDLVAHAHGVSALRKAATLKANDRENLKRPARPGIIGETISCAAMVGMLVCGCVLLFRAFDGCGDGFFFEWVFGPLLLFEAYNSLRESQNRLNKIEPVVPSYRDYE